MSKGCCCVGQNHPETEANAHAKAICHPLAINSFRHWVRLLAAGGGLDPKHWWRAVQITAVSPLWAPLRAWERLRYAGQLDAVKIVHPPLFIIGHWRTGSTHLHNLLAQDPALAFVSTFHALAPASRLIGGRTLRPLLARHMPPKRHMDDLPLSVDLPQEEEFAMCNVAPCSFYVGWYFPKRMRELFQKYALLEGLSDADLSEWKHSYLEILKKATLCGSGRRLVLKNPVNTARIRPLLELFPDAKFIHIYRNPYHIFRSAVLLHRTTLDMIGFQSISDAEIEDNVLLFFREMMARFFKEKHLISAANFAEIRYEDLEQHPMAEVERIYQELALPGFENARRGMEAYLASQVNYRKNRLPLTENDLDRIEQHWQFAIDAWGYERPSGQ